MSSSSTSVARTRKPRARKAPAAKKYVKYQPRRSYVKGRGAYYVTGGLYGQAKLGPYKAAAGFQAGYSSGKYQGPTMRGLGAYNVSNIRHNVLIKPDIPQVRNAMYAEGATIIRHREYLGPITTSSVANTFKIQSFPLNPAQAITFPWLSTIAANYEEYKPNGLMFEFRSTASDAIASSTNLALGQVMMVTQYDPTDPEFYTDVELLNYTWAQSGKVSDNLQHYVECDPKQSPLSHLYTREGGASDDSDLRFSDFGRFSIATSGLQGTSVQIGQLWVTYEFLMYKPKVGAQSAEAGGWYHFYNDSGIDVNQPLGTIANGKVDAVNNLNVTLLPGGSDVRIVIPAQSKPASFMITATIIGTVAGSNTAGGNMSSSDPGVEFVELNNNNTAASFAAPSTGLASLTSTVTTWVTVQGDGKSHFVVYDCNTQPGGTLKADLYVSQIPYLDPLLY